MYSRAAVALCILLGPALPTGAQPTEGERTFSGSWSAIGQQETIPTEGVRAASIVRLSGSLVPTGGSGLSRGFRGEAIGFDDGAAVRLVRSLWTGDFQGRAADLNGRFRLGSGSP